jgi:hypothetical protein
MKWFRHKWCVLAGTTELYCFFSLIHHLCGFFLTLKSNSFNRNQTRSFIMHWCINTSDLVEWKYYFSFGKEIICEFEVLLEISRATQSIDKIRWVLWEVSKKVFYFIFLTWYRQSHMIAQVLPCFSQLSNIE